MKRMMLLLSAAAIAVSMSAGAAVAAPTQAENYFSTDANCEELGEVVLEVTNLGNWGAGKIQGTHLTAIPRWFTFTITHEETDTVVFEESHGKQPADVDDICSYSFVEVFPEDDPPFLAGTYRFDAMVGVKVVGR